MSLAAACHPSLRENLHSYQEISGSSTAHLLLLPKQKESSPLYVVPKELWEFSLPPPPLLLVLFLVMMAFR